MSGNGQMVAYDGGSKPQRPEHRRQQGQGQGQGGPPSSRRRQQAPVEDDNVSDVSDAEYELDRNEEPRFKYSTADMGESSWRNGTCCLITMCILCVALAIVLSVVFLKFSDDEEDGAGGPTGPPTAMADAPEIPPGTDKFQSSRDFVNDRCSEANFDRDLRTCQSVCNGFDCCDPMLPEEESCLANNQEGCLNYARCHVTNLKIEPAPVNIDIICSPERIADDRAECELECLQLECCWSDENSCVAEEFYACLDYAPCQNLRDDARVPTADPTVYDFCSGETGSVSQAGACENACAPAECCWSEDEGDNCLQSDFFACLTYEPCQQLELPPYGSNVTAPSEDIGDLCSFSNVNTGGDGECRSACSAGSCCEEGALDQCFLRDPLGCLEYDSCKIAN